MLASQATEILTTTKPRPRESVFDSCLTTVFFNAAIFSRSVENYRMSTSGSSARNCTGFCQQH